MQLVALLHMTDSSFPSGAFAHSYGLETYTQQGLIQNTEQLIEFLTVRLQEGMERFDFILMREAMQANQDVLYTLDEQVSAMLTVRELRDASIQVGRRFLRTALPLYGGERAHQYFVDIQSGLVSGHMVLAFGVIAAELGIACENALLAYAHAFVMGQAAAAMKLINIGQTKVQQVIHVLQPTIQDAVDESCAFSLNDLHMFTPALDIRAMQHEYLFRRLFIS